MSHLKDDDTTAALSESNKTTTVMILYAVHGLDENGVYRESVDIQSQLYGIISERKMIFYVQAMLRIVSIKEKKMMMNNSSRKSTRPGSSHHHDNDDDWEASSMWERVSLDVGTKRIVTAIRREHAVNATSDRNNNQDHDIANLEQLEALLESLNPGDNDYKEQQSQRTTSHGAAVFPRGTSSSCHNNTTRKTLQQEDEEEGGKQQYAEEEEAVWLPLYHFGDDDVSWNRLFEESIEENKDLYHRYNNDTQKQRRIATSILDAIQPFARQQLSSSTFNFDDKNKNVVSGCWVRMPRESAVLQIRRAMTTGQGEEEEEEEATIPSTIELLCPQEAGEQHDSIGSIGSIGSSDGTTNNIPDVGIQEDILPSSMPFSTSNIKEPVALRRGDSGLEALPPLTVMQCFDRIVRKHRRKPALHQKASNRNRRGFSTWTWKQYRAKVDDFAKSLIHIGVEPFDIINIIGFNSREWFTANFGAIAAGAIPAGAYNTQWSRDICRFIGEHSRAKVVVVEGTEQLDEYFEILDKNPSLRDNLKAIVMYGRQDEDLPWNCEEDCPWVPVYSFRQFLELGKNNVPDRVLRERIDALRPNHVCTLIYTSGTTGPPKSVMLTHDNITWTVRATLSTIHPNNVLTDKDCMVSYLPLSQIEPQLLDMHMPLQTGVQIYFAEHDALRGGLGDTLRQVRPTAFYGVAKVWENFHIRFSQVFEGSVGMKKNALTWARKTAQKYWESREHGSSAPSSSPKYFAAKKWLRKAVLVPSGLDRVRLAYTSSAPIEEDILRFFASLDFPLLETYGLSECSGPHTINTMRDFKFGTVGLPMPGTQSKVDPRTGELCFYGRHVFAGYMNAEEETRQAIDEVDGFLHSGDVVNMDRDGFITIRGRMKELIRIPPFELVTPVLIEKKMKAAMPALSNCMVVDDKNNSLCALLCLCVQMKEDDEHDGNPGDTGATDRLAGVSLEASKEMGSGATTTEEARCCPKWKKYLDQGLQTVNMKQNQQRVEKWVLLPTDFTEIGGELTPTLNLRRFAVRKKYQHLIQ